MIQRLLHAVEPVDGYCNIRLLWLRQYRSRRRLHGRNVVRRSRAP